VGTFRDKYGSWREQIQEWEEDISEVGVSYIQGWAMKREERKGRLGSLYKSGEVEK